METSDEDTGRDVFQKTEGAFMAENLIDVRKRCCATCQFWTGRSALRNQGRMLAVPLNEYCECQRGRGKRQGPAHGLLCFFYKRRVDIP